MKANLLKVPHSGENKKKRISLILSLSAIAVGILVLGVLADAPPGPYFNGFETNTSSWLDTSNTGFGSIARQQSGYTNGGGYASGIVSAVGQWHARVSSDQPCIMSAATPCFGPFTRWGGYSQEFPVGGYRTQIDIYLDVTWAAAHPDARFDFSSSINMSTGTFLRDFVFNAGSLAVDFDIFPLGSSTQVPGAQWTIHSGDMISMVGGNRYGWFANEEI